MSKIWKPEESREPTAPAPSSSPAAGTRMAVPMSERTRDVLLWLAGIGGAIIIVETVFGALAGTAAFWLGLSNLAPPIPRLALTAAVVGAFAVLLLLIRSRLTLDPKEGSR
jgi:hypothetical protein